MIKDTKRDEQENIKTLNEISLKLNIEKETRKSKERWKNTFKG